MNFKGIATVGLGIIVGLMIDHMLTKSDDISKKKSDPIEKAKEEFKKYSTYLKSCSGDHKDDDIDYVSDDDLTSAMDISETDTPDNVDMLFIEPITFNTISTAYSIMGEVHNAFEHGRTVSINDILDWIDEYSNEDLYADTYRWDHKENLKKYGWVDPSAFEIRYNQETGKYIITDVAPVRLYTNEEKANEDKNTEPDTGSAEDTNVM